MRVTQVKYFRADKNSSSNLLANCVVVFDNVLKIYGFAIRLGMKGEYITMPVRANHKRNNKGAFLDVVHPIDKEFHNYFTNIVLEGYFAGGSSDEFVFRPVERDNIEG